MNDTAAESDLTPLAASPLPAARRVLVLAPHADDEVFGCGGTLRLLVEAGAAATVIVATDGALGGTAGSERLVAEREAEARAAAETLGYPAPVFWRLPDRGLRYGEALVAKAAGAMTDCDADLVFAPALTELHPDHQALALAAAEAVRRLGGPRRIAFYEVSAPLLPNTLIDITTVEDVKRQAMRCFATQLAQQPYDEHIAALNRYRSYTLGSSVRAAEAYFIATADDLAHGVTPLFESALARRRRLGAAVEAGDAPLASIVVRSMDRPTLAEALASVAAQTYPNLEVVVVNAKGERHSPLPDFNHRLLVRLVETGAPLARSAAANAGLDAARGMYVGFLDDDDTLDPEHVATLVDLLRREREPVVAYAGVRCMARDDPEHKVSRVFGEPCESRVKLLAGNFIPSHAPLFPRALVTQGTRFDETLEVYEDWDFWLQLAERARFVYADRVTATYFTGGTSAVSPLAYDAEAVQLAARKLFAKWQHRMSPDELKALGDLYHRTHVELLGAQQGLRERDGELEKLRAECSTLESEVFSLEDERDGYRAELVRKAREVELYMGELSQLRASSSWRMTEPVRALSRFVRERRGPAMRAAYDAYTLLPLSLRMRLRPLLRPLVSRVQARRAAAGGAEALPFDYGNAVAALESALPASLQFPATDEPAISIVVVDEGGREETLRSLAALRREEGIRDCEIVLVTPRPDDWSGSVHGVRLEQATGDADDGYRQGAAAARAPWLLCLSGFCCVLPGALAEARRSIAERPDAALFAPKLVGENARLVFPADRGRAPDPNLPEANYARFVARCPAAGFLLNKSCLDDAALLRRTGSGYLDALTDALRARGVQALYAPGMHARIADLAPSARSLDAGMEPAMGGERVLVLDLHTPTPDMDSGSVDAYFQMKIMGELGFRVTFAPVSDLAWRARYTADLQRIGVECLYSPYTASVADHLQQHGGRYRCVILSRLSTAETWVDLVRRECPQAQIVFNTVDLHFLREQRQAEIDGDRTRMRRARQMREREIAVMRKVDATWVISEAEAALLRDEAPDVKTFHLPLIMRIDDSAGTPFDRRKDVFFIGGYRHLPNVDAVTHFVARIWPRVRERLPGVRFHVVGSHPPPEILALAGPDIEVHGFVADAASFFNGCRVSVAPLRFGAGLKGKVGRSLGYGCPVVLTPLAAEGMALADGRNALIAASDEAFADAVVRLHENETLWSTLSREGAAFFRDHYSYEVGKATIQSLLETLQA